MSQAPPSFRTETQARDGLRARARDGRAWLMEAALPLWARAGFDPASACFHERLDQAGAPTADPRRVRVQARQAAVFAIAGDLGWNGPWRELTEAGVAVLLERARRPDGGVAHTLDAAGAPLDARRDLYDLAFVIFAFAHAARALKRPALIDAANSHLAWLDANWANPAGGYDEGEVNPAPPRRQNPHMHLFEALLALYETTRAPAHAARAHALHALFVDKLYDRERGALAEFFQPDWRPAAGEAGLHAEPGHHFEWSWLLQRYGALLNRPVHDAAEKLCAMGERGVDPARNVARDAMWIDGAAKTETARLWPQTERVKALARLFSRSGDLAHASAAAGAFDTLARYLETPLPGLWRDSMLENGAFVDEPAPASSFYHIMLALEEFIRLFDPPQAAQG